MLFNTIRSARTDLQWHYPLSLSMDIKLYSIEHCTRYTKQLKESQVSLMQANCRLSWSQHPQNSEINKTSLTDKENCTQINVSYCVSFQLSCYSSLTGLQFSARQSSLFQLYYAQLRGSHDTLRELHVPACNGAPWNLPGGGGQSYWVKDICAALLPPRPRATPKYEMRFSIRLWPCQSFPRWRWLCWWHWRDATREWCLQDDKDDGVQHQAY